MEDRSITVIPGHQALDAVDVAVDVETVSTADIELRRAVALATTIEKRAESINKHFGLAQKFGGLWEQHRLRAGSELIEARAIVEHGQWITWCKTNIKRGMRDIQQVMKMAAAPEPDKALALENKRAADGMRKTRNVTRIARAAERALLANAHPAEATAEAAHVEAPAVAEVVAGPKSVRQLIEETEAEPVASAPDIAEAPAVAAEERREVPPAADLVEQALAIFDQMKTPEMDRCLLAMHRKRAVRIHPPNPWPAAPAALSIPEQEQAAVSIDGIPIYQGTKRQAPEARASAPPADHRGEWRAGPP